MIDFKQEQAIASLNLTSLKPEDLSELWRRVNSSRTDIHDVREKVLLIFQHPYWFVYPRGDLKDRA